MTTAGVWFAMTAVEPPMRVLGDAEDAGGNEDDRSRVGETSRVFPCPPAACEWWSPGLGRLTLRKKRSRPAIADAKKTSYLENVFQLQLHLTHTNGTGRHVP